MIFRCFLKFFSWLLQAPELKVASIYLQFNDEVSDAARPTAELVLIHGQPQLRPVSRRFASQNGRGWSCWA